MVERIGLLSVEKEKRVYSNKAKTDNVAIFFTLI